MNEFKLSGVVDRVETKMSQRGTPFHILTVRDPEERSVPVAYFGTPPKSGEIVELTGRLVGRKGYLNLEIETAKFGDGPPKQRRGVPVTKPETEVFELDDSLPF